MRELLPTEKCRKTAQGAGKAGLRTSLRTHMRTHMRWRACGARQALCHERGLPKTGRKAEIIARLRLHDGGL